MLSVAALLPLGRQAAPASTSEHTVSENGVTFDHANVVDPFRLISEPNLAIDSKGAVYTSGPGGSASQQSSFWKSDDNGIQYHQIGIAGEAKQNSALGGGDTEYALAKDDTLYAADQEFLLCNATFRSGDRGNTFTTGETCLPGTDRPWMSVYDPTGTPQGRRIYFAANETQLGCYVNVSTDDGHTYLPANGTTGLIPGNQHCVGHMAIDPTNGTLYIPTSRGVWKSTDGGKTYTNLGNPPGPISYTLFANLATDSAGNLYYHYTRTQNRRDGPAMLAMIPKGSTAWSTPVQVSSPDLQGVVFPWIVAGDPGRIAMMYLGTPDTGFNTAGPGIGGPNAQWHVYAAFSTDAISCNPDCVVNPSPTIQQVQADDHVMHKGTICIGGFPGCLQGQADRSMADFFVITMDPRDGRVFLVWDDNADRDLVNNIGKSIVTIARQRTGPSLLANKGPLLPPTMTGDVSISSAAAEDGTITLTGSHGLPPGNYSTDPSGDATYPDTPVEGPNIPALDLNEAVTREVGSDYEFSMKLSDLAPEAQAAAAAQIGGTPSWMFMWWDEGATAATDEHYYVKWRGVPGEAEYGQVGDVLYPALGAPAPKFLTYAPKGTTSAEVDGDTLTITVPKAGVGNPSDGDKIDNVQAYAMVERGPVPTVIDATKAYSYVAGTPATGQRAADGYVQVSIDDPTFTSAVDATMTGGTWSVSIPADLGAGTHTFYARQVLSADLYPSSWPDVQAGPVASTSLAIRLPSVSIADASVTEGNTGQTNAEFSVFLSEPSTDDVTVPYSVAEGTAVAPEDFSPEGGRVTIPAGQTSATATVAVNGDTEPEPAETFTVSLGTPENATLADGDATGRINDDDGMPACTINGTEGADVLAGTNKDDVICGFGGNDVIQGANGNDVIIGGAGNDTLEGGNGNDVIRGQERDDVIRGGTGDDRLFGFAGADRLFGDNGNDTIAATDGVSGNDSSDGGSGTDVCTGDPLDKMTGCP